MFRYAELKDDPNKDLLLIFLYELERRGMLCSKFETSLDGKSTERVWYGNQSSKEKTRFGPQSIEEAELEERIFKEIIGDKDRCSEGTAK